MDYSYKLTDFENEFFNTQIYKDYEESHHLDEKSIIVLRDDYIKGNTAIFHEISRIISTNDDTLTHITGDCLSVIPESPCNSIDVTLHFKNNLICLKCNISDSFETFDTSDIIKIIYWIADDNGVGIPISVVKNIYTSDKILYQL